MKIRHIIAAAAFLAAAGAFAASEPWKDRSLSFRERAEDLCSRLTLEEKVSLMMNSSPAIERLGIPPFDWWSEALHGVGRNGTATVFPSCIGMAASFDDDLIENVFTAVSDEARAKNTIERKKGLSGKYKSLSFWTPNINVFRDPRWGRGQETYGEDPYMNGRMGLRVVRGLQGDTAGNGYYKLLACAKHYAVHSGPEKTRHSFDVNNVSQRDLWETYMPAFRTLVQDGDVREVMCAYQRLDGEACCGSDRLLNQILRRQWGFDGLVVSDCGAIRDFYLPGRHDVAKDAESASALAVKSGTDVECGAVYKNLLPAVRRGDISEAEIDRSVIRLLEARFSVGDLDPDSVVGWTSIPESVIDCAAHRDLARKMAREQMVLLKNNGILPLPKSSKGVMVMGPNAVDSTMQWGIYYGIPSRTVTILDGIRSKIGDVLFSRSCDITSMTESESLMGRFTDSEGRPGMHARYWNNREMSGAPVAEVNYTSPLHLDNGGNTSFAPGVNLTDFTLSFRGSFVADRDEDLDMIFNNDDGFRIIINGDTVHERWKPEPFNMRSRKLLVQKGKRYDIQADYMQAADGASLSFDIVRARELTIPEILDRAKDAETVIFAGGISPALEREEAKTNAPGFDNGDRSSIELPAVQREIIRALKDAGKRVVLVNCSGSAVALTPENEICDAILQAWYPGEEGGTAVADVLFGDYNPSGKLPVTFYKDDSQLPAFDNYNMADRTYRYFRGEPLYPFGHGLSYTTFRYGKPRYADGKVTVEVENTGDREGDEIVQVYLRRPDDAKGPLKTLRGYGRVSLKPGDKKRVSVAMPRNAFETWDELSGKMVVMPGAHELLVGPSSTDLQTIRVNLK